MEKLYELGIIILGAMFVYIVSIGIYNLINGE